MELIAFRIRMYKGIIDSKWVNVNSLAVLVGKNESGKTSLLKALHKFNPDSSESYDIKKEWPRGHPSKRSEEQIVCQAKFRLSDREKSYLSRTTDIPEFPNTVEVSRNYAGKFEVKIEGESFSDKPQDIELDKFIGALPDIQDEFSLEFTRRANRCFGDVTRAINEGEYERLRRLVSMQEPYLIEALSSSGVRQEIEKSFIDRYIRYLRSFVLEVEKLPASKIKVHRYVIRYLPKFVYMDDYRIFSGSMQLDEIQSRRDNDQLTEEDATFLALLELSELDLDQLVRFGSGAEISQRHCDLDNGGAVLTAKFSDHLGQRKYEIAYRAEGSLFVTYVKDDHDSALVELEERSKGFQWFFSFDLMMMHGTKNTLKGRIILLDEPGLHLHPNAQKDLLRLFEKYSEDNTLLYTTHLPFMIDLDYPDRIQILKEETEKGIAVTNDFTENPPEAKLVLQKALGMNAAQKFLVEKRNLIVEGVDDYWVLTELSNLLQQGGEDGLPKDVLITPGGGASQVVPLAAFMIGQKFDVIALFDSDREGRSARKKLIDGWLMKYTESHTRAMLLGDAVNASGNFELEDLFPEDFVTDIVKEVYSEKLVNAGVTEITLQGSDMIWQKVKRFMARHDIEIDKMLFAERLHRKLSSMEDISELPEETKEKAIRLFRKIRNTFNEEKTESS